MSDGVDSHTSRMFVPAFRHVAPPSSDVSWNCLFTSPSDLPMASIRPPPSVTAHISVGHSFFVRFFSTVRCVQVFPPSVLTSVPHELQGSPLL